MEIEKIVDSLGLDLFTAGVCLPCLTFVAFPLDSGDERTARREARKLAPELWADGLEATTLAALERSRADGVAGAAAAILDVRRHGTRSEVVRAIVWRLAELMVEDMHRRTPARQSEPSGASARIGWPVTSAINSKSRS
jgi:hypothetical protein